MPYYILTFCSGAPVKMKRLTVDWTHSRARCCFCLEDTCLFDLQITPGADNNNYKVSEHHASVGHGLSCLIIQGGIYSSRLHKHSGPLCNLMYTFMPPRPVRGSVSKMVSMQLTVSCVIIFGNSPGCAIFVNGIYICVHD